MKRHITLGAILLLLIIALPGYAAAKAPPLNAEARKAIAALKLTKATHGIYAIDAKTGKVLIDLASGKPLNPASNVKVVTAAVALKRLSGDYRFTTRFSTDAFDRKTGTIGNLYIAGNGDPFLVTEVTERMAAELAREGVRKINGNIVVDESYFDGKARQTSIGNQRAYAAATAATALNFNSVRIIVDRKGTGYEIKLDAPNDYVKVVNKLRATGRGVALHRKSGKENDTVTVSGGMPRRQKHFEKYVNISHPALYLGSAFKTLFVANGIPVEGGVHEGADEGTIELLREPSKQLRMIVDDMNRFSNNFVAEQLVKHLGAHAFGAPGTTKKGIKLFDTYLAGLGIATGSYTLVNGSGLSQKNRLSAKQLVTVLRDVYDDQAIRKDFINSLSIAGEKGTIKSRHKGPLLKGKLRGKTGTLNNVSTLTGYVPMRNGHTAIFAALTNGPAGWKTCHKLQDKIATMLAAFQ